MKLYVVRYEHLLFTSKQYRKVAYYSTLSQARKDIPLHRLYRVAWQGWINDPEKQSTHDWSEGKESGGGEGGGEA